VSATVATTSASAEPARAGWMPAAIVAALTLAGFLLRLSTWDQGIFGDELSTYWIVHGHSLGDVLSSIYSNDEITPPLYFVLSWLTLKIGGAPEWVRLPSLLAGTATIPLVYLLGLRTAGRLAGLFAAALFALSPFMIYYGVEARAYALMIALLTASSLALLTALEGGSRRRLWWGLYAAFSCGALLSHYTAVFCLAAQATWALWARPEARRALLLANAAVVAGFAPWLPGFIADNNSPTTKILDALQPFTSHAVRVAVEQWGAGYPYVPLRNLPGAAGLALLIAGVGLIVLAAAIRVWRALPRPVAPRLAVLARSPLALPFVLLLATPIGEALVSAVGSNLLGARNLNASWPALAVVAGALVSAAGPVAGAAGAALILAASGLGAAKALDADYARTAYPGVAEFVNDRIRPGDVIIDGSGLSPVPLTGLDVYLHPGPREFRLGLPISDKPFIGLEPVPDPQRQIARAFRLAAGHRVFVITVVPTGPLTKGAVRSRLERNSGPAARVIRNPPRGYRPAASGFYPSLTPLKVVVLRRAATP